LTQADLASLQSVTKTPILDSAVLPPRKPKRLGIVIGLSVGTVIGLWLGNGYNDVAPGHPALLAIIGVVVLAIVVHELGHLLAGSLVGFHFNSFGIGPVALAIEHGRPKVRLRMGTSYAGYVSMQVGAIHGRLLTAWSTAGVLGPMLVNYIREYEISHGVAKADAYTTTMHIMAGLLVVGFVANVLVKPVDESHLVLGDAVAGVSA
jgi:hypothetical protein